MKVIIEIEVSPEQADPEDSTGVTEETYIELHDALSGIAESIDIQKG